MAALANTCWWWMVAYMASDMAFYLLYKLARRDFWWWPGGAGVGFSLVGRIAVKVLVDMSGCIHFRNPVELGGSYYLFNAVMSQISCVASVVLYDLYYTGDSKVGGRLLYGTVGVLGAVWFLSFGAFLLTIKREYVHTFISLQTGSDYTISYFRDNISNEARRIRITHADAPTHSRIHL